MEHSYRHHSSSRSRRPSFSDSSSGGRKREPPNPFLPRDNTNSHLRPSATTVSGRHSSSRGQRPTLIRPQGSVRSVAVTSSEDETGPSLRPRSTDSDHLLRPPSWSRGLVASPARTTSPRLGRNDDEDIVGAATPAIGAGADRARYHATVEDASENEDDGLRRIRYVGDSEDSEDARQHFWEDRRSSNTSHRRAPDPWANPGWAPDRHSFSNYGDVPFAPPRAHRGSFASNVERGRSAARCGQEFMGEAEPPSHQYADHRPVSVWIPSANNSFVRTTYETRGQSQLGDDEHSVPLSYAAPAQGYRSPSRLSSSHAMQQLPIIRVADSQDSENIYIRPRSPIVRQNSPSSFLQRQHEINRPRRYSLRANAALSSSDHLSSSDGEQDEDDDDKDHKEDGDDEDQDSSCGPSDEEDEDSSWGPSDDEAYRTRVKPVGHRSRPAFTFNSGPVFRSRARYISRPRTPNSDSPENDSEESANNVRIVRKRRSSSGTSYHRSLHQRQGPKRPETSTEKSVDTSRYGLSRTERRYRADLQAQEYSGHAARRTGRSRSASRGLSKVDLEPPQLGRHTAKTRSIFASRLYADNDQNFVAATSWTDPGEQITFQLPRRPVESVSSPSDIAPVLNASRNRPFDEMEHADSTILQALLLEYCAGGNSKDMVALTKYDQSASLDKPIDPCLIWIHLQRESLCLKDLVDVVANDTRIDTEHRILALELLQKECPKYEHQLGHGTQTQLALDPGTVLRCDGAPDPKGIEATRSVIFCSFPLLQTLIPSKQMPSRFSRTSRHHMRALHKCAYESGDFTEHDTQQVFQKLGRHGSPDEQIYVPHIWFLACGNVIISSSHLTQDEIHHDVVTTQENSAQDIMASLQLQDGQEFPCKLDKMSSYFTVRKIIQRTWSALGTPIEKDFSIYVDGGERLTAAKWQEIVKTDTRQLRLTLTQSLRANENTALVLYSRAGRGRETGVLVPYDRRLYQPMPELLEIDSNEISELQQTNDVIVNDYNSVTPLLNAFTFTPYRNSSTLPPQNAGDQCADGPPFWAHEATKESQDRGSISSSHHDEEPKRKLDPYHNHPYEIGQPFLEWKVVGFSATPGDSLRKILDFVDSRLQQSQTWRDQVKNIQPTAYKDVDTRRYAGKDVQKERLPQAIARQKSALLSSSETLLRQFVPVDNTHPLVLGYWGMIGAIFDIVETLLGGPVESERLKRIYVVRTWFGIHEGLNPMKRKINANPSVSLATCKRCAKGFLTQKAAHKHLKKKHHDAIPPNQMQKWVGLASEVLHQTRVQIVEAIQEVFINNISDLHVRAVEAHSGVAVSGLHDNVLMIQLVTAFEFVFIAHAHMLKCLRDVMENMTVDNVAEFATRGQQVVINQLNRMRSTILRCFDQAMLDIAVSNESGKRNGSFSLAPIEPHFFMAILASHFVSRRIRTHSGPGVDVHRMYHEYTDYLHSEIRARPKKKLFPNIIALEDELLCVQNVMKWQLKFYNNLLRVLDPTSFRITTSKRIQQFEAEREFLLRTTRKLNSRLRQIGEHRGHVQLLQKQLRHAIEIQEESDHGAVWVFTLVTVLFLPLSFVTSFFGMNVEGIRDMEQNQYIFWIVAVPITCVVIGLALVYAYRWETWKQAGKRKVETFGHRQLDQTAATSWPGWTMLYTRRLGRKMTHGGADSEMGMVTRPERQQTNLSAADDIFFLTRTKSWWPRRD